MRLKNKRAIVTGASRGIGKAIAIKFLQEGASVVICDIEGDRLKKAEHELSAYGKIASIVTDVTNREQVEAMASFAVSELGGIDILANNAGVATFEPFFDVTDESWNQTLSINLSGVFICSQVVATVMKEQKSGGAIVQMGSSNGILAEAGLAHYNASKAGVILLGKSMAIELAPYQIRVNSVCPGFIKTDLSPPELLDDYTQKIPLNRYGNVDEVANAFCFLASDEASFITGTELVVDGGQICQE